MKLIELQNALGVLAQTYTMTTANGFIVDPRGHSFSAGHPFSLADTVEAWRTVREAVGLPTNPEEAEAFYEAMRQRQEIVEKTRRRRVEILSGEVDDDQV